MVRIGYGLINIIDSKAKCRHLKQLTCIGTARQVFICLRLPFLLGFCLGWCSNFVGFKSGQTQSAYLLQNMVSNGTQHPHPIPTTHCTLTQERGGEGEELNQREGLDEQQFTKLGRKYKYDWLYLQSITSDNTCRKKSLYGSEKGEVERTGPQSG